MICQECQGRTCIACDIVWHPEVSCADIAARRAEAMGVEEAATSRYLSANSKMCPNCKVPGVKVQGCDHMTCVLPISTPYSIIADTFNRPPLLLPVLLDVSCRLQRGSAPWQ